MEEDQRPKRARGKVEQRILNKNGICLVMLGSLPLCCCKCGATTPVSDQICGHYPPSAWEGHERPVLDYCTSLHGQHSHSLETSEVGATVERQQKRPGAFACSGCIEDTSRSSSPTCMIADNTLGRRKVHAICL